MAPFVDDVHIETWRFSIAIGQIGGEILINPTENITVKFPVTTKYTLW